MQPRRRFRFIRELAEGGFGKVYLAEMITGDDFSSVVAIKLLHGKWTTHEEIAQRSRDEARLLGRLRHRNIVRVEDLTSIRGQCAVIMEYLEGVDLKTVVNYLVGIGDRVPLRSAFQAVGHVSNALHAAYNHVPLQGGEPLRLIHRDIKPSNIMLTADGDVKLLDFGTARANFDQREAHTQALAFGSQAYMAPERLLGDPDTPAADVFSLGVTTFEIIAGGAFGKIHIRPERYAKSMGDRLMSLDLSGLDVAEADRARATLRAMLEYEPGDRPTSEEVVDIMEQLADAAPDDSLRRFAKKHVGPAMVAHPHLAEGATLAGATVFEDRSGTIETDGLPASDSAARAIDQTYLLDDLSSPREQPQEESEDPQKAAADTFDDFLPEDGSGLRPVQGASELVESRTRLPDGELEEDSFYEPETREDPVDPEIIEASTSMADPEGMQAAVQDDEQRELEERSHDVDWTPPEEDEPHAHKVEDIAWEPPPPPDAEEHAEAPKARGKGALFVLVGLLLITILGAGAWYASTQLGEDEVDVPVPTPAVVVPVEVEIPAPTESTGVLVFKVSPPDAMTLTLSNSLGYKGSFEGSGTYAVGDLAGGTYRTKLGSNRSTVEVVAGQTCTFRANLAKESDWSPVGCE
ncbi:MAG TPA: serine/threonine-protein kinase [Myxococcota bacterium]|nr:serine/threonine-protein kinase [Myxococcota bacterium]